VPLSPQTISGRGATRAGGGAVYDRPVGRKRSPLLRRTVGFVAAAGLACAGCFGPGNYRVSPQTENGVIGAGVWRTQGPSGDGPCYAYRPVDAGAVPSSYGWTNFAAPLIVTVRAGDSGFVTAGCFPWFQVPGPFSVPLLTPGQPFAEGDYFVNTEIEPGTYQSHTRNRVYVGDAISTCKWERIELGAEDEQQVLEWGRAENGDAPGDTTVVTIQNTDTIFRSSNCTQWTRTG